LATQVLVYNRRCPVDLIYCRFVGVSVPCRSLNVPLSDHLTSGRRRPFSRGRSCHSWVHEATTPRSWFPPRSPLPTT